MNEGLGELRVSQTLFYAMHIKLIFSSLPDAVSLQEVLPHFWQQWIRLKLVTQAGQVCP